MNFLEDEKGKSIESNVVQKLCNESRNTMNLSFARITSIDHMYAKMNELADIHTALMHRNN